MLIHVRDDENGGALCELAAARPLATVREIAALRPPASSAAAVCVACIVAGDFYMPESISAFVATTVATSHAAYEKRHAARRVR